MSKFAELKRNSKNSVVNLKKSLERSNKSYDDADERYWKFTVDEHGNGFAVIRFLPAYQDEEDPFVKRYSHFFRGPTGKYYVENCLSTLDQKDPVQEANAPLWETNKEQARDRKRRLKYISNILVLSDPKNPQNEGKNFLFEYGPKIFQKIQNAISPTRIEGDDDPDIMEFNPFDLWHGANFRLKARVVDGQRSYDMSKFDAPSPLYNGDDEKLEPLYNKIYSLQAEIAPEKFKSYDELKRRFHEVIGVTETNTELSEYERLRAENMRNEEKSSKPADKPRRVEDDEDDSLSEYAKLLGDDDDIPF